MDTIRYRTCTYIKGDFFRVLKFPREVAVQETVKLLTMLLDV